MLRIIKTGFVTLSLLAMGTASSLANEEIWTYKYWQVFINKIDTGEDLRVHCTMQTVSVGEDREWRLHIGSSNGDARPPDYFPAIYLDEQVKPGQRPSVTPGDVVAIEIDGMDKAYVPVESVQDDKGRFVTRVMVDPGGKPDLLRAMRQGSSVLFRVETGGHPRPAFQMNSLHGFTAAYLKMSEACQFGSSEL